MQKMSPVSFVAVFSVVFILLFPVYFLISPLSARAAAGSGTITVNANSLTGAPAVVASSTANWLEFTFKNTTNDMPTGEVVVFVPAVFPLPQASSSSVDGYTQIATSTESGAMRFARAVSAFDSVTEQWFGENILSNQTITVATERDADTCATGPTKVAGTEGKAAMQCGNTTTAPDNGDDIYGNYVTANVDWGWVDQIGTWGLVTKTLSAGDISIQWDDSADNSASQQTTDISAQLSSVTWQFASTTMTGANKNTVGSWGLQADASGFDSHNVSWDEFLVGGATSSPEFYATTTLGNGAGRRDVRVRVMGLQKNEATAEQFTLSYGTTSSGGFTAPGTPGQYVFITQTRENSNQATTSLTSNKTQPKVYVKGRLVLGEHGVGSQIGDALTDGTATTSAPLLRFRLDPWAETASTTLTFDFTNTGGIVAGDFANTAIYVDSNNNGKYDPGADTTAAFGTPTISGTTMAFTSTTTIASRTNYFLVSDINNLVANDTTTISLAATSTTAFGALSQTYTNNIGGALSVSAYDGPANPGTGVQDATVGTLEWASLGNATTSDGSRAIITLSAGQSKYMKETNFGFNIPTTAIVLGILVEIQKLETSASCDVIDNSVRIVKGNTITGDEKADTVHEYSTDSSPNYTPYGGSGDLWGTTWTPADINATNFGVAFSTNVQTACGASGAAVDHIRISVYYTGVAPATHTVDVAPSADLQQIDYRFRQDTVAENINDAWLWAENATSSTDRGGTTRLRVEVSNEGAATSDKTRFKLQSGIARNKGSGLGCSAVLSWMPVGEAGSTTPDWAMSPSNFLTDAASTTDFTGSLTNENTTFVGGAQKDQNNQTIYAELSASNYTEHEFSLLAASSTVNIGTTFCFRLVDGTTGATQNFTYVQYPVTTITRPANVAGGTVAEDGPVGTSQSGGIQQGSGLGSGGAEPTPPGAPSGGGVIPGGGGGSGESGFIPFLRGTFFALIPFFLRRWW